MDDRDDLQVHSLRCLGSVCLLKGMVQNHVSVVGSGAEHDAWLRWLRKDGKRPVVEFVQSFLDELSQQANTAQKVGASCECQLLTIRTAVDCFPFVPNRVAAQHIIVVRCLFLGIQKLQFL